VKDFNDSIVKDSTQVADAMRTVITFVLKGIKHIGNAVLGISGAFRAIGIALGGLGAAVATALGALPDLATEMIMGAVAAIRAGLESLGAPTDILDSLFGTEAQIKARMRTATANADAAGRATRAIFASVKGDLGNIVDDMEDFNDTINNMIGRMNAARGTAARIKDPRTPRPPGAPKPPAADPGEEMVFTVGEVEAVPGVLSTGETAAEFKARMDSYGLAINDLKAKLAAAGNESLAMETRIKAAGKAAGEMGANAFLQLGSGIAYAMGEMAAGASNLKDFGDAMANLAGQIAGSFGQLFIQLGAGFLLTAPAVGAGLIAAGLALQTLSGFLSGKGSGNRGGGGRGGRSAASNAGRDIAREISRSLRPSGEDGPAVTNIEVVIGGRSIQPEMVAIVDDIARQRRSRYLGRRMGV
jgi:hypothetical protein